MKRPLGLLIVLATSLTARAQTVPTTATPDEIDHWLRSGDPRMVAWGATFAAQTADTSEIPVLASLAENYQALPPRQYDSHGNYIPRTLEQQHRLDSMQTVLDALIQLHGTLVYEAITAVLPDFPDQALTLFAAMPEPERSQRAAALYSARDKSDKPLDWRQFGHQRMIHMAAAILSLHPPPGFAASLLNETTIDLTIAVADDDEIRGALRGGATCGDSFALQPAPGWPEPYTYVVEQRWKSQEPEGVIIPGEPAITSRRARTNSSCSTLPGFGSAQRMQLALSEAGLSISTPGADTLQYDTLRYPGLTDYPRALAALIETHREQFRKLAAALAAKSFLTSAEATAAMPAFSVEIEDQRNDKTQPLTLPQRLGPRINVHADKPRTLPFSAEPE